MTGSLRVRLKDLLKRVVRGKIKRIIGRETGGDITRKRQGRINGKGDTDYNTQHEKRGRNTHRDRLSGGMGWYVREVELRRGRLEY